MNYYRNLVPSTESDKNLLDIHAEELRLVLYFLILLWHSPEGRRRIQRQPILNLLSSLTNRLLRGGLESIHFDSLRETVVTCFCILDTDASPPIQNPKQEDVWKFSLDAGSSNLVILCRFHPAGRLYAPC